MGKHPQIPQLLAHFEEQGNFYIVQEFIQGQTLREELEAVKTLSEKAVVKLLKEGLTVLSFVHQQGVIHRDIKPDNLMRRRDGRLFLIDFGAVKTFTATVMPQTQKLTTTVTIGTAGYMPDEQQRGRPLPASDVYALGMVAIEALTGKSPMDFGTDPNTGEVMWHQATRVDKGLAEVLTQMVRHHYSRRYIDGSLALTALERVTQPRRPKPQSSQTQSSQTQRPKPAASPPKSRRRVLQWLGYGAVAAGGAIAWEQRQLISGWQPPPANTPDTDFPGVSVDDLSLETVDFNSAEVDNQGNIIDTPAGKAQVFVETTLALPNWAKSLDMIVIPPGNFQMGSHPAETGHVGNELPQHRVTVPAFMMGRYAVTQAQYAAVTGQYPSYFSDNGGNRPVERVSWEDSVAFCEQLSQRSGRAYRLPSEAEWEYACRAGTTTPFSYGPTITTELANYNGNFTYGQGPEGASRGQTTAVGSFPPNDFGLHDMHGNVWEWCQDKWHSNYNNAPRDGSAWVEGGSNFRLLRGGSWLFNPRSCRSANRNSFIPANRSLDIGVRVVVSVART